MQARGSYYVLTGERDSGKTLLCIDLAAEARARGLDVAGILTAQSSPGLHAAREVIDLRSGSTHPLTKPAQGASHPLTPGEGVSAEVLSWVSEVLDVATPCDLLIVDELGPAELVAGRGWVRALDVLRAGDFGAALVVCGPSLLDELETSLGRTSAGTFAIDSQESYDLPDIILEEIFG